MWIDSHLASFLLLFVLLNPFLMSIYLIDLTSDLGVTVFPRDLAVSAIVSGIVFMGLAWGGDAIFSEYLHVRFASVQVFGGVVFPLIGMRFVLSGADAMRSMRGQPKHVTGSIAIPFMIGPGTVSASVVVGARLPLPNAAAVILLTLAFTVVLVTAIKIAHDYVKERNARIIDRYVEIVGRLSALLIGTIAVKMIFEGLGSWLQNTAPVWK